MLTLLPKGAQTKYFNFIDWWFFPFATDGASWDTKIFTNVWKNTKRGNGIHRGLGETDWWKDPEVQNHCPFNVQYQQTLPFHRLDPLTVTTGIFNTWKGAMESSDLQRISPSNPCDFVDHFVYPLGFLSAAARHQRWKSQRSKIHRLAHRFFTPRFSLWFSFPKP